MPLILHYKMNDNAANTTVLDASGNGFNGTSVRNTSVVSVAGKINTALTFNGSSDYIQKADEAAFNVGASLTAMAWIKCTGGVNPAIVNQYDTGSDNRSWHLRLNSTELGGVAYRPRAYYSDNGVLTAPHGRSVYGATPALNDNAWHHVAIRFATGTTDFIVDGTQYDGVALDYTAAITTLHNSTAVMAVGCYFTTGSAANFFSGTIDDVRIYNEVLSVSQIKSIYNAGNGIEVPMPWAARRRRIIC